MSGLGQHLVDFTDEIVHRWYEAWRASRHPHQSLSETTLKDKLPKQLRVIGEQLRMLGEAEDMRDMWKVTDRLDPEERISQEVPIEEVVKEYRLVVDVVRDWIEERDIEVSFSEYTYFYGALYELVAESVRRYANHQAELVRRDRAHYLAGVMHQLRTPLHTLSLQTELLADSSRPPTHADVHNLRRNVRRMQTLVDGILRLERFHPDEIPVHPETVAPAQIIDDIMDGHRPEGARKQLRFESLVDPDLRLEIDPDLFIDAIGNLIQNAVKYTTNGFVIVEAREPDGKVQFLVCDSGPGIPAERLATLFEQTQPAGQGGAGIGLQIACHAARAQGGSIEVRSEVGRGSTFCLCIPRSVSPRPSNDAP